MLLESSRERSEKKGMDNEEQKQDPETPELISVSQENSAEPRVGFCKEQIIVEARKQLMLSGPLICVFLLLSLIQVISVMFVGHVGELALAGASVANSFALVTGFCLLLGMGCALDTLCGQSYGAREYHMLGIYTQRTIFVLLLVSIPIAGVWASAEHILVFLRQDPAISAEAGQYARFLIPAIFAYAVLSCLYKFLVTQSLVVPMMSSTGVTTLLHILICWILVFKAGLGSKGAALATDISYLINDLLLAIYIWFSPSCKSSWKGFSKEAFRGALRLLRLAISSALMICAEIWAFELMVILAGLLPNPKLEISALSISLNISTLLFMIPLGLGETISVRVSNELGAGQPKAACLAIGVVIFMVATQGISIGLATILGRKVWGRFFTKEQRVVKYVSQMLVLLAAMQFLNGFSAVLNGIARGCGWQKIGAIVNLGSYYLIGIPSGILLAFVHHLGGKGLWIGIIIAVSIQVFVLFNISIRTDWEKEASKASARVRESMVQMAVTQQT